MKVSLLGDLVNFEKREIETLPAKQLVPQSTRLDDKNDDPTDQHISLAHLVSIGEATAEVHGSFINSIMDKILVLRMC